ncbi:MAG: hypothetical protein ACR2KM_04175 [Gemmatimonadaceae bacterium]
MGTSLFPADAVAQFRAMNTANLPHTALVERPGYTRGAGAITQRSYTVVAVGVPCRRSIAGHSAGERLIADQLEAVVQSVVVFDAGTDVRQDDRLTVSGLDGAGNPFTVTVTVVGVLAPIATETMRKALCAATTAVAGQ